MTIIYEHVGKIYDGRWVLKDFNLEVEDRKCYGFVGPEGSGKTTALKIFMGTEKADEGEMVRMGDYKYPTLQTAYVSQEGRLNPKKNAVWNAKKFHWRVTKGRAAEELLKFLPEERLSVPVEELTVAEKKLVEYVGAMLLPADFIVLDEPFTGMDDAMRQRVTEHLMTIKGSRSVIIAQRTEENLDFARIIHFGKSE